MVLPFAWAHDSVKTVVLQCLEKKFRVESLRLRLGRSSSKKLNLFTGITIALLLVFSQFAFHIGLGKTGSSSAQQVSSIQIPENYYYAVPITVSATSLVGYVSSSNVSTSTSFMTSSQFSSFETTGDYGFSGSTFDQNGTQAENVVLVNPGTYYLVFVANCCDANVTYEYDTFSNFEIQNATMYVGEFVDLAPHSYESVALHLTDTLGSSFDLSVIGASNQTVRYSIYDALTQETVFSSPEVTVSNVTSPSLSYNFTSLPEGLYYLYVNNTLPSTAFVYFEYHVHPKFVNPFVSITLHGGPNSPQPMGIAAYGITNDSGSIIPYQVETSEVVGMANITSLLAYNATAVNVGVQPYEATLQLNSMLVVKDANGSEYVYWPQNVMDFITNSSILALTDNVLNVTGDGAFLTNRSITSQNGGYVLACYPPKCEASQYYYGIYGNGPVMSYELPLHILLSISESVERGTGVLIQMGASFLQNGTISSTNGTIFDRITILDPNIESGYFYVSGNESTPVGAASLYGEYYDTEFVFGGGGNGASTDFEELNSTLGLYYSALSRKLVSFPSYYSFGADTAEAADNLQVLYLGNGVAEVYPGTPNYEYLNQVTTITTSSSSRNSTATSATSFTSFTLSATASSGSSLYWLVILASGTAIALAVASALVMMLRRPKQESVTAGYPGPLPSGSQPQNTTTSSVPTPPKNFCWNCGTKLEPETRFCPNCGSAI